MKNLFKKKKKEEIKDTSPKPVVLTINNNDYIIKDDMIVKVQAVSDDISVYGWSLEMRVPYSDGTKSDWFTYFGNRIYNSRASAIDASIKVGYNNQREVRVTPLYKMTEPQYRDYKIEKVLKPKQPKKEYSIKGWKLKDDFEWYKNTHTGVTINHKKGSVYIQLENGSIIKTGSCSEYTHSVGSEKLYRDLIPNGLVEEIKIEDEKWMHPHLLKELKVKLNIK